MSKGKHLTLDDRKSIQIGLQEGRNFREIAREIGKDPSTVSKEIRKHRVARRTASFNPCSKAAEDIWEMERYAEFLASRREPPKKKATTGPMGTELPENWRRA